MPTAFARSGSDDAAVLLRLGGLTTRADGRVAASLDLDTRGEAVNALDVRLALPAGSRVFRIEDGNTIMNIWIEHPGVGADGILAFSGIIPGGFSGETGRVVTIVFDEAPKVAEAHLLSGEALRHDGKGTSLPLGFATTSWETVAGTPADAPVDREPPEEFRPEVVQSPELFGGRPTLVFSTEDKQSGMAHYEVMEVPAGTSRDSSVGEWRAVESPYLLTDPSRQSDIYVRAVDAAGNFRIVVVPVAPAWPAVPFPGAYPAAFGWFLVVLAITVLWIALRARARS